MKTLLAVVTVVALAYVPRLQDPPPARSEVGKAMQRQLHTEQQLLLAQQELERITTALATQTVAVQEATVAAQEAATEADRLLNEYIASLVPSTPVVPVQHWESSPDFSQAPFASLMPEFPQYRIPKIEDCEWTIANGVATSTRGLPPIPADQEGAMLGAAYRASVSAGHELPITFGVYDNAGPAVAGGLWYHTNGRSITAQRPDGTWTPVSVEIVGLDDQCEVEAGWSNKWGHCDYLGLYNIGLRSPNDSFNIRANDPCGKIIVDGCWLLPYSAEQVNTSGIHCANWHTMVVRRTKARGETPGSPPQLFREHNFYFKNTGPGGLWVLENELQGGNGTCFQVRPGMDDLWSTSPNGPIVVAYNRSNGYGWDHTTSQGGSAISVWSCPDHPVFVYRNRILDARYGCLLVSHQGQVPPSLGTAVAPAGSDRNFYGVDGYPIGPVYIADNEFSNPRATRPPVQIAGCAEAHIWSTNVLHNGQWFLNGQWAAQNGFTDKKIGKISLYGGPMQGQNYWTWDRELMMNRPLTMQEIVYE